jgi:hypothetical protein
MTEKVQSQHVDFTGQVKSKEISKEMQVMDYPTQVTIVEMNKNYNKMINNMFAICAKSCIRNFNQARMSIEEKSCAENCQKKYYSTFVIGKGFVNQITMETEQLDIFSNTNEVDLIKNSKKI